MAAASYRKATDMRIAPVDSLYIKVSAKNMRSKNRDLKKSEELGMKKKTLMSVSRKWPTSPVVHPNYSLKSTAKA